MTLTEPVKALYTAKLMLVAVQLLVFALYADVKAGNSLPGVSTEDFSTSSVDQVVPLITLCILEGVHLVLIVTNWSKTFSDVKAASANVWDDRLRVFYKTLYVFQPVVTLLASVAIIIYWSGHFSEWLWWCITVAVTFPIYVHFFLYAAARLPKTQSTATSGPRFTFLESKIA